MRPAHRHMRVVIAALLLALVVPSARAQLPRSAGRVLVLEEVRIGGQSRTPEHVIRRYLALEPGDEITADVLGAARARLDATDYFKSIEVFTRPGSERGNVIVFVDVEERRNPVFETGFGYHDLNGWYLTLLGLRLDNVIGADSQTRIGARLGFRLGGFDAEWRKTVSRDGRVGLGLKIYTYNIEHRFFGSGPDATDPQANPAPWQGQGWQGYQQDIARGGIEGAVRYLLDRHRRIELGLRVEGIKPDSTFRDDDGNDKDGLPDELSDQNEDAAITGFFVRAFHDTRNNIAYPTRGSFARLTLGVNNTTAGTGGVFTKAGLDLRKHFRAGDGRVLSSHLSGGITSKNTPYYERYYLGGNYSIRGFEEWSLSATAGDDGFWMVNQELRLPLAGRYKRHPRLIGLVFIDVGQGWHRGIPLTTSTVEAGTGYGLRLLLPWLGTFGMDVGIPISEGRTGERFRVHFLLGFSF